LAAIKLDPTVVSIDVDKKINLLASTPSTVSIAAVAPSYTQWDYTALRLGEIHPYISGNAIVVAVIDTGVDRSSNDLSGQVLDGCDWVTSPTNVCTGTGLLDENGHGTHVAGIVAAKNDGQGITGVAPGSKILPLRVLDASGTGYLSDIPAAIDYAVANGADVINMSLGGTFDYYLIKDAVDRALAAGVIVVAAAGNSGPSNTLPSYPAAYDSVIAVAATDSSGTVANYSSQGSYIDIAAPGSAIVSTYRGGYASLSGTSMASPHVAGVVALMLERNISPGSIKSLLQGTADSSGSKNILLRYGAGIVVPYLALSCNSNPCTSPSPTPTPTPTATGVIADTVVVNPGVISSPSPTAPNPEPTQTPTPSPVQVIPTVKESLSVTNVKRKISISVAAPTGSKTWVQRKSGSKWRTVLKFTTVPSVVIKVSRSGTYRVKVVTPTETVTTHTYKIK
jgi:subtilisin family serine protease